MKKIANKKVKNFHGKLENVLLEKKKQEKIKMIDEFFEDKHHSVQKNLNIFRNEETYASIEDQVKQRLIKQQ